MPYDPTTGRITAPVTLFDVMTALGVATPDVATLCTSDMISPYSLVRPLYHTTLGVTPEDFIKPEFFQNAFKPTECENTTTIFWEKFAWGYWVPYTTNLNYVDQLKNVLWKRTIAKIDGSCWLNLAHFDGYLHVGADEVINPVTDIVLEEGKPISVSFAASPVTEDAVRTSWPENQSTVNKGGIVSMSNVLIPHLEGGIVKFTGDYYFGATIYRKKNPGGAGYEELYILPKSNQKINAVQSQGGGTIFESLAGCIAEEGYDYKVIPWVTNKIITKDSNGNLSYPSGTKIITFGYLPSGSSWLEKSFPLKPLTFQSIEITVHGETVTFKGIYMSRSSSSKEITNPVCRAALGTLDQTGHTPMMTATSCSLSSITIPKFVNNGQVGFFDGTITLTFTFASTLTGKNVTRFDISLDIDPDGAKTYSIPKNTDGIFKKTYSYNSALGGYDNF